MSRQLQPSVPLVTLVKTEPPTVIKNEPPTIIIKNEPPEEALEKEISPDIKDINIVYHSLSEDLIKNETALENIEENILETKYSESLETQVLVKTEDTSDENVTRDTNQEVIEVQGSHEHSNTLSNLETHKQLVLNSSKDLNGIGTRSRKAKHAKKTDFAWCYKTDQTTSWEKEKIKIIRARDIPVESHEYNSLAEDEYVCNHCQHPYKGLCNLKYHIRKMHREVTTMQQCPYCPYKSKWNIQRHIIQKHKDTKNIQWFQCNLCIMKFKVKGNLTRHMRVHLKHKDTKNIQWFQCNLCEMKFNVKGNLTRHMRVHLRHKQMKDGLDLHEKRYYCDTCDHETYTSTDLKRHKLVHLRPEDIQYFYCYHCSDKFKQKYSLKIHIFRRHFKNVKQGKRHQCDKCDYETYRIGDLNRHNVVHLKPEEIQYMYCYHCSNKFKHKKDLQSHIFKQHFKIIKRRKRHHCDKCNYKTYI